MIGVGVGVVIGVRCRAVHVALPGVVSTAAAAARIVLGRARVAGFGIALAPSGRAVGVRLARLVPALTVGELVVLDQAEIYAHPVHGSGHRVLLLSTDVRLRTLSESCGATAEQRRTDTHVCRAVGDRRLEVVAHAGRDRLRRRDGCAAPVGELGEPGECSLRVGVHRRHGHQPAQVQFGAVGDQVGERGQVGFEHPAAVGIAVEADLDEHLERLAALLARCCVGQCARPAWPDRPSARRGRSRRRFGPCWSAAARPGASAPAPASRPARRPWRGPPGPCSHPCRARRVGRARRRRRPGRSS